MPGPAPAGRERLPWSDPASKRVRFIVPATSSAAGPGHQAPKPGGGRAGEQAVSGGYNTVATGGGAGPVAGGVEAGAGAAGGGGVGGGGGGGGGGAGVGTARVKRGMADMLKGGVIMDVVTPEQARIAEDAGAVAVMALERVPADIRAQGGVARMSDPDMIDGIIAAVSIPVMAKCRIGHFAEAQVLQAIGADYVDE